MVLTFTDQDIMKMREIVLDANHEQALRLIKEILKRLDQQKNTGMKSHLDK